MANRRLDDRYELRERVGSGGMAEVWEGFDHNLSRRIAIKMLHPHLAADPNVLARFRSEAKAAARLTHPAIVAIYDTVGASNNDAIIMEFVEGRDLRTILNERPTLAAADAVEVGLQLAGGLGHAHQNGIIHRDVKPANILVRPDRRVKLSDFGIAKAVDQVGHTETGSLVGTVKYLAPEQIEGKPVDGRTDLYGLSTVLYEMLCGEVPFAATDLMSAMDRLKRDAPSARLIRPDLPLALDVFLQRSLARNPDDRYDDASKWAAALSEAMLGGLVIEKGDPTMVEPRPTAASIPERRASEAPSIPSSNTVPKKLTGQRQPTEQERVWSSELPEPIRSAKQRAKPNPETATHMKRSKSRMRWVGPLISLILMVAAVATVWFLLTDAGESFLERFSGDDNTVIEGPAGEVTGSAQSENAQPVDPQQDSAEGATDEADGSPIFSTDFDDTDLRATSFDPFGNDGVENEGQVSRPFDGNPDTFWSTQLYRDRNFGQLKEGVGLIVEFAEPRAMEDIEIDADRLGWAFELYAADAAPATFDEWGDPIGAFTELEVNEVLDVDDRDVGALLFWVTDLGIDPEQTQAEYEADIEARNIIQQLRISRIALVN